MGAIAPPPFSVMQDQEKFDAWYAKRRKVMKFQFISIIIAMALFSVLAVVTIIAVS